MCATFFKITLMNFKVRFFLKCLSIHVGVGDQKVDIFQRRSLNLAHCVHEYENDEKLLKISQKRCKNINLIHSIFDRLESFIKSLFLPFIPRI